MNRLYAGLVLASAFLVLVLAACAPSNASTGAPAQAPTLAPAATQASSASPQSFTVLVGGHDNANAADIEAYFPSTIRVHVGDTVVWKLNTSELHTVTFLAGEQAPALLQPVPKAPPGAMMFNPQVAFPQMPKDGQYDGSSFANSGVMSRDPGQAQEFKLTFTKAGSYPYTCIVHGEEKMNGTVVVEDASVAIPSQAADDAEGKKELAALKAQVPAAVQAAQAQIKPDQKNPDGTTTHFVVTGYSQGPIDLEDYYPNKLTARPGDTVTWVLGQGDIAPHTITFLNGATEPAMISPQPQPNGPPLLLVNPAVGAPQNADQPLTNKGVYSSGIIDPHAPGAHSFSLKIGNTLGDLAYHCILHDDSGMKGSITIAQ